jgi:hypothetical protein
MENVPTLGWGRGKETTFAGALEAALSVTDYPCDYTTLMGVTGLAFRTRWFQGPGGPWCPSSAVGEFPEEIAAASRATGWTLRVAEGAPLERFAPDIVASLNDGLPVLAYGRELNMAVIFGYEEGGKTMLLRDYFTGDTPLRKAPNEFEMFLLFPGEHTESLAPREAAIEGWKTAVRNWHRRHDPLEEVRGYWYGDIALAKWREDLGLVDELSNKERELLFMVNWWCFDVLQDARCAAGTFLQDNADLLEGESRDALKRAAAIYAQEGAYLGRCFCEKSAFFGPWSGKSISDWTPEVQQREQDVLAEARRLEADAIAEIEKALCAAGIDTALLRRPA